MVMKINIFQLFRFFLIITFVGLGNSLFTDCQCLFRYSTFLEKLDISEFIAHVNYIDQEPMAEDSFWYDGTIHKIAVIQNLSNFDLGDTISIVTCGGLDCYGCFNFLDISKELILRARFVKREDVELSFNPISYSAKSELLLYLNGCIESELIVIGEDVIGNFSYNQSWEELRVRKLLEKLSFGKLDLDYPDPLDTSKMQRLKFDDVEKRLMQLQSNKK